MNQNSMLMEYKDGLRKAILRNKMPFARFTHCLQLLLMIVNSAVALLS